MSGRRKSEGKQRAQRPVPVEAALSKLSPGSVLPSDDCVYFSGKSSTMTMLSCKGIWNCRFFFWLYCFFDSVGCVNNKGENGY